MITINSDAQINAEEIFSLLMERKTTATRFRLPYTTKQVYDMLFQACRVEVLCRKREFNASNAYKQNLFDIATWLTGDSSTFGLFICGGVGNGKTTIIKALKNLTGLLRSNEPSDTSIRKNRGFIIISAKELVKLSKAYNNPTKDCEEQYRKYKEALRVEVLAIDDLGTEPKESIYYGDYVTAAIDMLSHRYEEQLCTIISSNLAAAEISKYYDERIADRFREMMQIINFYDEPSFRKQ